METKFFTFNQNNSGGYFVEDKNAGVCETVIIEASNESDAFKKLSEIGESVSGFWNYCSCCGERWYGCDDSDGTEIPMLYGKDVATLKKEMFREECYIHYLNGVVKHVEYKEK